MSQEVLRFRSKIWGTAKESFQVDVLFDGRPQETTAIRSVCCGWLFKDLLDVDSRVLVEYGAMDHRLSLLALKFSLLFN